MLKIALAGNPNSGKTTLFNALTGSTAHVGNWPGVTVDKREGICRKGDVELAIVDLPGIYSLSPYTPEEVIARNYILDEKPDCIINVVDATNIERNLYLTTQLLEIDVPVVIALNMADEVRKSGLQINEDALRKRAGVPVVSVSALKGDGINELVQATAAVAGKKRKGFCVLEDTPLSHLVGDVKIAMEVAKVENPLFHAIKLIENDPLEAKAHPDLTGPVEEFKNKFDDAVFGNDFEAYIADARYKFICKHYSSAIMGKKKEVVTKSDKADKILTNKWLGIPIFLLVLFTIFHLTFSEDFLFLGAMGIIPADWVSCAGTVFEGVFGEGGIFAPGVVLQGLVGVGTTELGNLLGMGMEALGATPDGWVYGLVVSGVYEGIAAVLSFVPQILVLFLLFSILEDSGYMARIAFILDKLFRKFGLSGRAFMPMIMGFGCSVPAMINTRTLADENERTATVRVIPFFSCGAKLPILTAVAGALVSALNFGNADVITYSMYLLGIVVALISVILMRSTTMRGEVPPFIMELPPYRAPGFLSTVLHLWDKLKHFIEKAFTIILASTVVIWFVSHFSFAWEFLPDEEVNKSILASIGQFLQPIFTPLGFGSQLGAYGWVFVVAAIMGLIAKENVISTFGTLAICILIAVNGSAGGFDPEANEGVDAVVEMIKATNITVPGLISFIAFNMLTIPCFAAVATAKGELGKKKFNWTLLFWVGVSYFVSTAIYCVGSWWWTVFIFAAVIALAVVGIVLFNKKFPKNKAKRA